MVPLSDFQWPLRSGTSEHSHQNLATGNPQSGHASVSHRALQGAPPRGRQLYSVDVSDIFYFFLLGEGEGGVRGARRGVGSVFIENPTRGWGGFQEKEGPRGCLRRIGDFFGGGGLNFFFSGPKRPPSLLHFSKCSRPFIQSVKSTLSRLKSRNPVVGTRQASLLLGVDQPSHRKIGQVCELCSGARV